MAQDCSAYAMYNYERRRSTEVHVGALALGGAHPIRLQSMTNTPTDDTEASVAQAKRIADAGAELVRLTAQGTKEALNLRNIREQLRADGYDVPLVADIHFNAGLADVAAAIVEKVRINPGNYVDPGRTFKKLEYTDAEYAAEVAKIRERLVPLLHICRAHGTALRIGVNHGSLSDRIMSRYGDTPAGMAESCMEFLRICRDEDFRDVVLSIKASNTSVMVLTVRRLVQAMEREGMAYPLHLGVTEAGDGEDGRIKSAVGIGALLADGIGDTVRVSLSEDPECEIPVARALVDYITARRGHPRVEGPEAVAASLYDPLSPQRFASQRVGPLGGGQPVCVCGDVSAGADVSPVGMWCCDLQDAAGPDGQGFVLSGPQGPEACGGRFEALCAHPEVPVLVRCQGANPVGAWRAFIFAARQAGCCNPIVLCRRYDDAALADVQLKAAADFGVMLIDRLCDGILIEGAAHGAEVLVSTSFSVLQAARARFTKTEYIACPSCGRTLFDLQQTLARIKAATAHLVGLKIGVMGCIVNGPGEMADADYGYVGAGPGRVSLYRGKECVERGIPADEAVDRLLALIHGDGHR